MKKPLLFAAMAVSLSLTACDKDSAENSDNKGYGAYVSGHIELRIADATGTDLLEGENAYTENDIDIIYYDADGTERVFYDPMLGSPKRVYICGNNPLDQVKQKPWVRLFLNHPTKDSEITTTLVRFGKNPIDTFKAEWVIDNGSDAPTYGGSATYITKVWLNGELFYDRSETIEELPVIVRPKSYGFARENNDSNQGFDDSAMLVGVWKGTCNVAGSDGFRLTEGVRLELYNDGKYLCHSTTYEHCAVGTGAWSVSGGKIVFKTETLLDAMIDWTSIEPFTLDGEFAFTMQDNKLILSANKGDCRYEYTLTKIIL